MDVKHHVYLVTYEPPAAAYSTKPRVLCMFVSWCSCSCLALGVVVHVWLLVSLCMFGSWCRCACLALGVVVHVWLLVSCIFGFVLVSLCMFQSWRSCACLALGVIVLVWPSLGVVVHIWLLQNNIEITEHVHCEFKKKIVLSLSHAV